MRRESKRSSVKSRSVATQLNRRWKALSCRYLPLAPSGSMWRYSRPYADGDPEQGWKLHISATILTANDVLAAVAPLLQSRGTQFKAVSSLAELSKLNSGLYYGYSQVGKFITVYPKRPREALFLARRLHTLTCRLTAPAAPFDQQFQRDSCVYYRYGSFRALEIENPDGSKTLAMRDPDGNLVPDLRNVESINPGCAENPFLTRCEIEPLDSPLKTSFLAFTSLVQRGKGGVYKALDLRAVPPRLCVIKEGRRDGETNWDGRDGRWRVKHEKAVLGSLMSAGVESAEVYSSFELENNFYLVTEYIEGSTLQDLLSRRRRRLPLTQVFHYSVQLAELLARIHAAGWTWRDCKPSNILVTEAGSLRPLDFEGASRVDQPDSDPWGTPDYVPPEWHDDTRGRSREPEDLYALGAVMYLLITGIPPASYAPAPIEQLRQNSDPILRRLISELLHPNPRRRPRAQAVALELKSQPAGSRGNNNKKEMATVSGQAAARNRRNVDLSVGWRR